MQYGLIARGDWSDLIESVIDTPAPTAVQRKIMPTHPSVATRHAPPTTSVVAFDAQSHAGFGPIRTRRVFEDVADDIRRRISRGEYRSGDKLPAERELAMLLSVSRQALREALRMLEHAGVLTMKKGVHGGAFVREGDPEVMKRSLRDLMDLGHVSLRSMMEARALITDAVIPLVCERAQDKDFDLIELSLRRGEASLQSSNVYEAISVGTEFYRAIAAATHNEVLELLVNALSDIVRYVLVPLGLQRNMRTWDLRWNVLNALRRRDVAGARKELHALFNILESAYAERERLIRTERERVAPSPVPVEAPRLIPAKPSKPARSKT